MDIKLYVGLGGLIFCDLVIAISIIKGIIYSKKHWISIEATLDKASDFSVLAYPWIYTFCVDNVVYSGRKLWPTDFMFIQLKSSELTKQLEDCYSADKKIAVFYEKNNPHNACMKCTIPLLELSGLVITMLAIHALLYLTAKLVFHK